MAEDTAPSKGLADPPNCFTLREKEVVGISLYEDQEEDGGFCLTVGDAQTGKMRIPLAKTSRDEIHMFRSENGTKRLPRLRRASIPKELWPKGWLDGNRKIIQAQRGDMCALIHVCTSTGEGGSLAYTATSYREAVENGLVVKRYDDLFPPPGVDVLAMGYGQDGNPQMLLRMTPRSSFRIVRSHIGLEDASPVIIVTWHGEPRVDKVTKKRRDHALQVWSPPRFTKAA